MIKAPFEDAEGAEDAVAVPDREEESLILVTKMKGSATGIKQHGENAMRWYYTVENTIGRTTKT